EAEIEKMVKEAEAHAEEDRRERERIDARNEADSLIYSTEKSLKEVGDKISASEKSAVENAVKELKDVMEGKDTELIKQKTEALKQASYKLSEELYRSASAQGAASEASGSATGESASDGSAGSSDNAQNADDVDYKVVDDDK
ncbi:MAG TPA: Hsp70 family protein, partial [Rectinema sp.]|nr:Hsp70 family protein [Rectinema sp.]